MTYGSSVPNFGSCGDARAAADLAHDVPAAGATSLDSRADWRGTLDEMRARVRNGPPRS